MYVLQVSQLNSTILSSVYIPGESMKLKEKFEVKNVPGATPAWQITEWGNPVAYVQEYLLHLEARDFSPSSIRSYAYGLLKLLKFLDNLHVDWKKITHLHIGELVLFYQTKENPQRAHQAGKPQAGSVNVVTGKRVLSPGYKPATINQTLAIISDFYNYQISYKNLEISNPVLNTVSSHKSNREKISWPMYKQRVPRNTPRGMSDELWKEFFETLTSNRDRALFALAYSSGARANELLNLTFSDIDFGRSMVRVISKGTRNPDWIAVGPQFFQWLTLYLNERGQGSGIDQVWITENKNSQPLTYTALRAIMRRANEKLGTNWVMHDLRHTFATNLANDGNIPLEIVRAQLRHAQITTTQKYISARPEVISSQLMDFFERREEPKESSFRSHYDADDLDILFPEK